MTAPSPREHGRAVASMCGRIARWYDFLNHALSLGQDIYWRHRLVRLVRPAPGAAPGRPWRVLDLAAGTEHLSVM